MGTVYFKLRDKETHHGNVHIFFSDDLGSLHREQSYFVLVLD